MSDRAEPADLADVQVTVEGELPRAEIARIRERVASLARYPRHPPRSARMTLRVGGASRAARTFYVADASLLVDGRTLAAHATGRTAEAAADEVCDRLRRQMRRAAEAELAPRHEPAVINNALEDLGLDVRHRPATRLGPPEEREIVAFIKVPSEPETTLGAVAELIDHDYEFNLFRHARSGEDVVVHRREDESVGLLHPPGSPLFDENDVVVPEPSRYSEPITLVAARAEMDALDHRFVYFIAAQDLRGKVLYLRHAGNYGLVELA